LLTINFANMFSLRKYRTKTGIDIKTLYSYIKKYQEFSKTKWGAFTNGFFMGIIEDVVNEKAKPTCEESKFWGIVQCFVGGADVALDKYYENLGVKGDFKTLPDSAVATINEIDDEGTKVEGDKDVKELMKSEAAPKEGIAESLKAGWDWFKGKVKAVFDGAKKMITGFYDKVVAFFTGPLVTGIIKVGGCVASKDWVQDAALKAIVKTFLTTATGMGGLFAGIIMKAPFIWKTLKELYAKLKAITLKKFESDHEKFYNWGKGVAAFFDTVVKILTAAKKLKKYRKLFKRYNF